MLPIRNNPIHRNSNLLCSDSSRRTQSVRCTPLEYSSSSDSPRSRLSTVGEVTSPCVSRETFAVPGYVAVEEDFQGPLPSPHCAMDFIPLDYYSCPFPIPGPRIPHHAADYNTFDSVFGSYPGCPSIPEALPADGFMDSWGVANDPLTAQQPPSQPPTVPEGELPPHPPFGYHQCGWLSGPACDGIAPGKNREMAEHLRVCHHFIGHERDVVQCEWENCGQTMQRMNVPRHIVSRHLLEAANCRICGKRFSRPDVVSRHEKTCVRAPASSSSRKPQKMASRSCTF